MNSETGLGRMKIQVANYKKTTVLRNLNILNLIVGKFQVLDGNL